MGRFKDLTGQKFGRLTVLRKATDEEIGDRDRKRGYFGVVNVTVEILN